MPLTDGIDTCPHLVARDFGTQVANTVARRLVMPPQRVGGQAQFIPAPMAQASRNDLSTLMHWARQHLHEPLEVSQLARRVAFRNAVGLPPSAYRERFGAAHTS